MRSLLENHPDKEKLTQEYEEISLGDLEDAVRECDSHIGKEKQRIQTETRLRKPQLPLSVHDRLSMLKRQATNMMKQAEELDDDRIREKEAMINKVNEIMKDRETLTEPEQKKAIESIVAEVSCEICGTCYAGEDENETHLRFRIHIAYKEIRDRLAELKPRVQDKEKDGRRKDRTKEKDKDRDKEKETEKDKDDADKDKKEKDNAPDAEKEEDKKKKSRSGSREKSKDRGRGKDKGRRSRSGGDGSKERGRGKDRKGKDKRKRSASDSRKRDRSASGKKRRKASASRKRRSRSRDKRGRR